MGFQTRPPDLPITILMNSEGNEKYYCSVKSTAIQPVQTFPLHRADCVTHFVREFQSSAPSATLPFKVPPLEPFDNSSPNS